MRGIPNETQSSLGPPLCLAHHRRGVLVLQRKAGTDCGLKNSSGALLLSPYAHLRPDGWPSTAFGSTYLLGPHDSTYWPDDVDLAAASTGFADSGRCALQIPSPHPDPALARQ